MTPLPFFTVQVEMHNYSAANAHAQKMYNWNTLNGLRPLDPAPCTLHPAP